MPLFAFKSLSLASMALGAAVAQAQLWDQIIQTNYGPVQGFKHFNESTLETFFGISESNVTAFLGTPFAADTGLGLDKRPVLVVWWGMALKDDIRITFNRRDDVFGYLSHPELNAEGLTVTGHNTSGNYGVLDQLEVLKWVKKNIANFGGDPDRVVMAGHSFGSSQVYHAVNSPLFKGYFHGGISQSGIRYPYEPLLAGLAPSYVNMSTALIHGADYVAAHNVSSTAELRTLSMEELLVGSQDRINSTWISWVTALSAGYPLIVKPVLDDYVLPSKYIETLINGPANDVPVITGNTKDESGAGPSTDYTMEEYENYTSHKYGDLYNRYISCTQTTATKAPLTCPGTPPPVTSLLSVHGFTPPSGTNPPPPRSTPTTGLTPRPARTKALSTSRRSCMPGTLYTPMPISTPSSKRITRSRRRCPPTGPTLQRRWILTRAALTPAKGALPHWSPNSPNGTQVVMELGNAFANVPIAKKEQVEFLTQWYHQQIPY